MVFVLMEWFEHDNQKKCALNGLGLIDWMILFWWLFQAELKEVIMKSINLFVHKFGRGSSETKNSPCLSCDWPLELQCV